MKGQQNAKYKAFIRSRPCAICGSQRGVEAAHTGPRGLGQKAADSDTIPLCRRHHRTGNDSYHALGPRHFANLHQLDIPALIAELNLAGRKYLEDAHRPGRMQRSPEFTRFYCACGWRTAWYQVEQDARTALDSHLDRRQAA